MALAIATNNAALNAAASASSVNRDMETSMARLSTGKRINSASDDAAGVAISSRLSAEIRGTDQAIRNSLDGQALIDTAEGAHKEIENILQRMREVSVQAANDTNNSQDRANLQAEMDALVTEIDRIAGTTTWAGEKLMEAANGTDFSFQVGAKTSDKNQINITINGMGANALGLKGDPTEVGYTLGFVSVGESANVITFDPAINVRQGNVNTATGVVTPNNGNTSITLQKLGASLADVTYNTIDPASINAAVAAINAGTAETNITATVGADGSNNAGKVILDHNTDAATAIGEHVSLSTVYAAYDTAVSDPAATIEVNGQEGTITFNENAGTVNLVLARKNSDGTPQATYTIDTTADLQTAVDAINGSLGAGTTAHGYTASIVAAADGSPVGGTIKLTSGPAHADNTQVSFSSLDLGAIAHTSKVVTSSDGSLDTTTGVFAPNSVNTTGTINLTLAGEAVTVEGISNKGASPESDAAAIAAAINAGGHGYTAAAMTGADAGKVQITQPAAPTQDILVTNGMGAKAKAAANATANTATANAASVAAADAATTAVANSATAAAASAAAAAAADPDAAAAAAAINTAAAAAANAAAAAAATAAATAEATSATAAAASAAADEALAAGTAFPATTLDGGAGVNGAHGTWNANTFHLSDEMLNLGTDDRRATNGTLTVSYDGGTAFNIDLTAGMGESEMHQAIGNGIETAVGGNPYYDEYYNHSMGKYGALFYSGNRAKIDFTSMVLNNGSGAGVSGPHGTWNANTFHLSDEMLNLGSDNRRATNDTISIGYSSNPADHVPGQEPAVTTTNTADHTPAISTVASAKDTITLNAAALTAGFTLTLQSGVTVTVTAGETTQKLADKINAGTGKVTGSGAAPASHNGHGYTAAVSGDVITLTAVGAITGGAGADDSPSGTSTAAGGGTMAGVAVSSVTLPATNDTITMNAAALTAGFTLTLESGVTVTATAGETTQKLADKINAGTGTVKSSDATAGDAGHGYSASVSGDVITLTAAGAITHSSAVTTAAGDGTMAGVSISMTPKTTIVEVALTAGMGESEMHQAIGNGIETAVGGNPYYDEYYNHSMGKYGAEFYSGFRDNIDLSLSNETIEVSLSEAATAASQAAATAAQAAATATAASIADAATAEAANTAAAETDAALANAGTPEARAAALQAAATAEAANEAANEALAASAAAQAAAENAHQAEIEAIAAAADGSGTDAKVNALSAIKTIDAAIQTVNIQRSKLGAVSNRLSHTINNLTNISSNLSAAQGGIEDADFAKETTDLAKNQILQQASTAMLAQANASKQNVLSLLQG